MVEPHLVWGRAHVPERAIADAGIVGTDQHVAVKSQVRTTGITMAMDLGDGRFVHVGQGSQAALESLDMPRIIIKADTSATINSVVAFFPGWRQVVAGAERIAGTPQDDAVN